MFFSWTGKTVPAESVSAPVFLEAPDEEEIQEIQEIQELPEEIPDEAGIQEVQEEIPGEEGIQEIREEIPDEAEIQEIQEEIPDGGEEKAATTEDALSRKGGIPIDEAHFPDSNFRRYLVISSFDKNKDGILSEQEIKKVDTIDCYAWEIKSFKGIEYFTEIKTLRCGSKVLTSLDVSQNKKLKDLRCRGNALTSLDVSQNKKLCSLSCDDNRSESLAGAGNICHVDTDKSSDRIISCVGNRLEKLDLRGGANEVYCNDNELISLRLDDVADVYCQNNVLTELDLRNSSYLRYVDCSENMLRSLDMSRNFLKDLSIGNENIGRQTLICNDNRLESIKFGKDIYLECLYCENNRLKTLDLRKMRQLRALTSDPGTRVIYADAPGLVSIRRDQKGAELTWDHKGVSCSGFFIYRKEGKGGWKKAGEIRKGYSKGRYSYTDKYTGRGDVAYTVAAFQTLKSRIGEGAYEDHQGAYDSRGLNAPGVPSAPKNVRAVSGKKRATLTWKKVPGASGYHIYRKASKNAKWKKRRKTRESLLHR